MIFLEQEEVERVLKSDFYMAAMTAEIRRGWVSQEQRADIHNEDFLLGIHKTNEIRTRSKKKIKKQTKEEYTKVSKGHWMGFANIKEKTNG